MYILLKILNDINNPPNKRVLHLRNKLAKIL